MLCDFFHKVFCHPLLKQGISLSPFCQAQSVVGPTLHSTWHSPACGHIAWDGAWSGSSNDVAVAGSPTVPSSSRLDHWWLDLLSLLPDCRFSGPRSHRQESPATRSITSTAPAMLDGGRDRGRSVVGTTAVFRQSEPPHGPEIPTGFPADHGEAQSARWHCRCESSSVESRYETVSRASSNGLHRLTTA